MFVRELHCHVDGIDVVLVSFWLIFASKCLAPFLK